MKKMMFAAAAIALVAFAGYTLHAVNEAPTAATLAVAVAGDDGALDDARGAELPPWQASRAAPAEDDAIIAGTVPVAQIDPPPPPRAVAAPEVPDAMRGWKNPATSRPDE